MPSDAKIQVFKFQELSEEKPNGYYGLSPKERAREWVAEANCDSDRISDMFNTELFERGLRDQANDAYLDAHFSLGYSQGDGVAFEGTVTYKPGMVKAPVTGEPDPTFPDIPAGTWFKLYSIDNHYTHWNTFGVEIELPESDLSEIDDGECPKCGERFTTHNDDGSCVAVMELEDALLEYFQALSKEFERMGYAEIEYQSSDEACIDACEANEWVFDVFGRPVHHLVTQ